MKSSLLAIFEILKKYSDYDHPMTQGQIIEKLQEDYGIEAKRRQVSDDVNVLRDGFDYVIENVGRRGCYLDRGGDDFDDSELRLLIDSVLSSRHIPAKMTDRLVKKLCKQSTVYFPSHVKYIKEVDAWSKGDNKAFFYNIEIIDEAIEKKQQISYDYNKYDVGKKLVKTSEQVVSPYTLLLHNQHYYLMGYNHRHQKMSFCRVDRISNIKLINENAFPLKNVPGYEKGIDYTELATGRPYMYADKLERVQFTVKTAVIDQVVDWFGDNVHFTPEKDNPDVVTATLDKVSPAAMAIWAKQYLDYVEVTYPQSLREKIKKSIEDGVKKYQ